MIIYRVLARQTTTVCDPRSIGHT